MPTRFHITVNETDKVAGLLYGAGTADRIGVTMVLGHGAGADQSSGFMVRFAEGLAVRGIDAVTFNFLYTEQGRGAPDRTEKLEACFRSAISTARQVKEIGGNRMVIGGKSMGGRIASQVAAAGVEELSGLVFLGYPLHPPGKRELIRSKHLSQIREPMLFVQGSRDSFGTPAELRSIIEDLSLPAKLYEIEGGDHSFKVPKSAPTPQERVYEAVMDEIARWAANNARS